MSLTIAIIRTITWSAIFEHNYHPRIYRYNEDVMILQMGESELAFNHPPGAFSIWWLRGRSCRHPGIRGVHVNWLSTTAWDWRNENES